MKGGGLLRIILIDTVHAQTDTAFVPIDTKDTALGRLPGGKELSKWQGLFTVDFGDVTQTFDTGIELDENAEVRDVGDRTDNHIANSVAIGIFLPLIGKKLFHRQRYALVIRVDGCNDSLDFVTLLHDLGGMVDPPGPGHIGDMD